MALRMTSPSSRLCLLLYSLLAVSFGRPFEFNLHVLFKRLKLKFYLSLKAAQQGQSIVSRESSLKKEAGLCRRSVKSYLFPPSISVKWDLKNRWLTLPGTD